MPSIRRAAKEDAKAIRALIWRVGINPIGLDWRRFVLAVDENGTMMGCGQVKPHSDGTRELASIAVWPRYQGQGIGTAVVRHLMASYPPPLYLTCAPHNESFYLRFGFVRLAPEEMPPYFLRVWRLFEWLRKVLPVFGPLRVMIYDPHKEEM